MSSLLRGLARLLHTRTDRKHKKKVILKVRKKNKHKQRKNSLKKWQQTNKKHAIIKYLICQLFVVCADEVRLGRVTTKVEVEKSKKKIKPNKENTLNSRYGMSCA